MRIDIVTLFPEMCENILNESIIGRARARGYLQVCCHQLRDHGEGVHKRVDDCTFGGGKGMLLMAQPIAKAFDEIIEQTAVRPHIVYMSPRGRVLDQEKVKELAKNENIIVLCGHYEGVDERVLEEYNVEEISIGDFVLTGGELPALCMIDAVARMVPGVLAGEESYQNESIYSGLLEYPQYTRPAVFEGMEVPTVLRNGNHGEIAKWQREQSLLVTAQRRPDLLRTAPLTQQDIDLLRERGLWPSGEQAQTKF